MVPLLHFAVFLSLSEFRGNNYLLLSWGVVYKHERPCVACVGLIRFWHESCFWFESLLSLFSACAGHDHFYSSVQVPGPVHTPRDTGQQSQLPLESKMAAIAAPGTYVEEGKWCPALKKKLPWQLHTFPSALPGNGTLVFWWVQASSWLPPCDAPHPGSLRVSPHSQPQSSLSPSMETGVSVSSPAPSRWVSQAGECCQAGGTSPLCSRPLSTCLLLTGWNRSSFTARSQECRSHPTPFSPFSFVLLSYMEIFLPLWKSEICQHLVDVLWESLHM